MRLTLLSGGPICVHVGSQHSVDSRLVTLLSAQPLQKVRIQTHRNGLLCRRHDHTRVLPERRIGGACVGVAFNGLPDPSIGLRAEPFPIAAWVSRRSSSRLLFHAVLPSMPK
jgi:hypothetical protein